jgi:hypothetical protein
MSVYQSDMSGAGFVNTITISKCDGLVDISSGDLGGFIYLANSQT